MPSKRQITQNEVVAPVINNVFVDRENAQKLYNVYYDYLKSDNTFSILYYWGVGGIGKSTLMNKLKGSNGSFVIHNLEKSCDEAVVLFNIRKMLNDVSEHFSFPRFDVALYAYLDKTGNNQITIDSQYSEDSIKDSAKSLLSTTIDFISKLLLPSLGVAVDVGKNAINSYESLNNLISTRKDKEKYKKEFNNIHALYLSSNTNDTKKLLENVITYFINDYNASIEEIKRNSPNILPIVIGIDTFEIYDSINNKRHNVHGFDWLNSKHNNKGVIFSLNNTLWIINGRNQMFDNNYFELYCVNKKIYIKQNTNDPIANSNKEVKEISSLDFEEIENYCIDEKKQNNYVVCFELNYLDKEYVNILLDNNGICDEKIKSQIYQITNGVPQFVDLCVDLYKRKTNASVEDYKGGISDLTDRYLKEFNEEEEDIIIKMATIGKWSDDEMFKLLDITDSPTSTYKRNLYENILKKSFIKKVDSDRYIFHKIVCDSIYKSNNNTMTVKTININEIINIFNSELSKINIDNINYHLNRYVDIIEKIMNFEQLKEILEIVRGIEQILRQASTYITNMRIYEKMYNKSLQFSNSNNDVTDFKYYYAEELSYLQLFEEALKMNQQVYDERKELLGDNHLNTIASLNNLAESYFDVGNYNKALELCQKVYDKYSELFGDNHLDTIMSLNNLSISYLFVNNYQKALELCEKVYEENLINYDDNDLKILTLLNNLSICYSAVSNYTKALDFSKRVYETRKSVLGETHPDTLNSLSNLAASYLDAGEHEKALKISKKVYELRKEYFGDDHFDTIASLKKLANCYSKIGENTKAFELAIQALKIENSILQRYSLPIKTIKDEDISDILNSKSQKMIEFNKTDCNKYKEIRRIDNENMGDTLWKKIEDFVNDDNKTVNDALIYLNKIKADLKTNNAVIINDINDELINNLNNLKYKDIVELLNKSRNNKIQLISASELISKNLHLKIVLSSNTNNEIYANIIYLTDDEIFRTKELKCDIEVDVIKVILFAISVFLCLVDRFLDNKI